MLGQPDHRPWACHECDQHRWERDQVFMTQVQAGLLQAPPAAVPGATVHGCTLPYFPIGGDYFDFCEQPDGTLRVIVADAMGKGTSAAFLATLFRGAVRALSPHKKSPGDLLQSLNDLLCADLQRLQVFVTAEVADYDPGSHTVTVAAAGAPCPILVRAQGRRAEQVKVRGVALGIRPARTYTEVQVPCQPGDLLVMFSDGMMDAQGADGKSLGIAGLAGLVEQHSALPAPAFFEAVLDGLLGYAGPAGIRDDVTLVAACFGADE